MAKFLPVIGEVTTALESAGKLVAAGVTAPFNREAAGQLLEASGQAWVNYTRENAIACAVRGDGQGIARGADACSKSFPVVSHARAVVHLVRGEGEEAYECAMNGTKAIGVIAATSATIAATAATGGLGAVAACSLTAGAAAGTQVGLDGVDTGIRSAIEGELSTAGTWAGVERAIETGNAVDIFDAGFAPAQTAAFAAAGCAASRLAAARAAAAEQDLTNTGARNSGAPQARSNPSLNLENLERLPDRSGAAAGRNTAPSDAGRSAGSGARNPAPSAAGRSAASGASRASVAESASSGASGLRAGDTVYDIWREEDGTPGMDRCGPYRPHGPIQRVNISEIQLNRDFPPDATKVAFYKNLLRNHPEARYPPIKVDANYNLVDGFHRVMAHQELGRVRINAIFV